MALVSLEEIRDYVGTRDSAFDERYTIISNSVTADIESYIGYELQANTHTDLVNICDTSKFNHHLDNIPLLDIYEVKVNNTVLNDTRNTGQVIPNGDGTKFSIENNAELSSRKSKFGSGSLKLPQADSTIVLDAPERMQIGDSSFTVEMWINSDSIPATTIYKQEKGTDSFKIDFVAGGAGNSIRVTLGSTTIDSSNSLVYNQRAWNHVAFSRDYEAGKGYIHLNGTKVGEGNFTDHLDFLGTITIGNFVGYVDEFRLSSVARYSNSNVTVSLDRNIPDENTLCLLHFDNSLEDATQLASSYMVNKELDIVTVSASKGDTVQIRYKSGYDLIPDEIKWAALELIRLISKSEEDAIETAFGNERMRKQGQYDNTDRYPRQVQRILDRYRK